MHTQIQAHARINSKTTEATMDAFNATVRTNSKCQPNIRLEI